MRCAVMGWRSSLLQAGVWLGDRQAQKREISFEVAKRSGWTARRGKEEEIGVRGTGGSRNG